MLTHKLKYVLFFYREQVRDYFPNSYSRWAPWRTRRTQAKELHTQWLKNCCTVSTSPSPSPTDRLVLDQKSRISPAKCIIFAAPSKPSARSHLFFRSVSFFVSLRWGLLIAHAAAIRNTLNDYDTKLRFLSINLYALTLIQQGISTLNT